MRFFILVFILVFLTACGEYYNDKKAHESIENTPKSSVLNISISGVDDSPVEVNISNNKYTIYENGIFSRDVSDSYTISIDTNPADKLCNLFDVTYDINPYDNYIECYDKDIGFSDKTVEIGRYKYIINGNTRVRYSSEENIFSKRIVDVNETNNTKEEVYYDINKTLNSGLFFDDSSNGDTAQYIVNEVVKSSNTYDIQEDILDAIKSLATIESINRTYIYDTGILLTYEYDIKFNRNYRPVELLGELAQALKTSLDQPLIDRLLHSNARAIKDVNLLLAVDVFFFNGSYDCLYSFRASTRKIMQDGEHFPTPNISSEKDKK